MHVCSEPDIFRIENDAFIESVLTNNPTLVLSSYKDALQTLKVTLAANRSVESGMPISIENFDAKE